MPRESSVASATRILPSGIRLQPGYYKTGAHLKFLISGFFFPEISGSHLNVFELHKKTKIPKTLFKSDEWEVSIYTNEQVYICIERPLWMIRPFYHILPELQRVSNNWTLGYWMFLGQLCFSSALVHVHQSSNMAQSWAAFYSRPRWHCLSMWGVKMWSCEWSRQIKSEKTSKIVIRDIKFSPFAKIKSWLHFLKSWCSQENLKLEIYQTKEHDFQQNVTYDDEVRLNIYLHSYFWTAKLCALC